MLSHTSRYLGGKGVRLVFAAIQVGAVSELWISGEFEKDSSVHVPAQGTKQTLSKTYIMSRIRCTKRDNRKWACAHVSKKKSGA